MTITRRDFFKIVSTAAGGLVLTLDTRVLARPPSGIQAINGQAQTFAPNAWVRIMPDNRITIVVDKSEMGQGVMTALPMLVAEELDADWEQVQIEQAPAAQAYINPTFGEEATGGSSSVSSSYRPLRYAGAVARLMLLEAARAQTGAAIAKMQTLRGEIIFPKGSRVPYGTFATAASRLPVPHHAPLKAAHRFTLIGRSIPRVDTPSKTTGAAVFGIDIKRPGLVVAAVRQSSSLGGHLKHYDDQAALKIPGVIQVQRLKTGIAVIAVDTWTAQKGLDAVHCLWEAGPYDRVSTASLRADYRKSAELEGAVAQKTGDARAHIAAAKRIVTADYEVPFAAHATLEPMNCTTHIHDGLCEIWVPTQSQTGVQIMAARITGFAPDRILVHTTLLGGAFGRRLEQDFVEDAVLLAKTLPRPVKVFWSRAEDMTHDFYRPYSYQRLQAALDAHGHPTAWWQKIVTSSLMQRMDPGAIHNGVDPTAVSGAINMTYRIPHIEIDYIEHPTPVPVGFWRSVSHSYTAFAKESFIDELAHKGHQDPLLLRQRLLAHDKQQLRVLDAAADAVGWGRPLTPGRGRGIAVHPSFGSYVAQVVEVTMAANKVHIDRVVCVCDCGLAVNPNIVRAQLEGAIVFGLQAALKGPITVEGGRIQQTNFDGYPLMRIDEMPDIDIRLLRGPREPMGVGEPGVPPIAPALCNALFAASGVRHRTLPLPLDL